VLPATVLALDANTFTMGTGEMARVYRLDGSPTILETPAGRSTNQAGWKEDKLVIETTLEAPTVPCTTAVWPSSESSSARTTRTTAVKSGPQNVAQARLTSALA
jgi:hypothetical protein